MTVSNPHELDPHAHRMEELAGKASAGAAWTFFGFGLRQVIRLGSNLVLTRMLDKELFGVMLLVNVFVMGLELFSDVGIGPAVIQNEREDESFVNTVWTIQVLRGFLLFGIACAAAPVYAYAMNKPILTSVIPVAGLVAIADGFLSTKFFTQNRELAMKRIIVVELAAQIVGVAVMITWAWRSPTVWALVWGGVAGATASTIASHIWLEGIPNRFRFEKEAARSLFHFGVWIFFSTVAMYLADYSDRFIFGRITSEGTLGVYSIALTLAAAPAAALSHVVHSVVFPLYSRVANEAENLPDVYKRARFPLLVVGGWMTAGLLAGGPTIVRMLYTEPYWEGGWMLQLVVAGMWFGVVLQGANHAAVLALGKSNWTFSFSFVKLLGIVVLVYPAFTKWGFAGAIAAVSISEFLRYAISAGAAARFNMWGLKQDAALTIFVAGSAGIGYAALRALPSANVWLDALVVFVVVTALWAPLIWPLVLRVRRGEALFDIH